MRPLVLLTGATGFIGSHVTERLLQDGLFQVLAIVRESNNAEKIRRLKHNGVVVLGGVFYEKDFLEKVFTDFPITHVIHLAAIRGEGTHSREDYYDVNVLGTEKLLEASLKHKVQRFVYCSSVGVFGIPPSTLPATLESELKGDTAYQKSKILAEQKVEKLVERGLDTFVVRPTITYGNGDQGFPSTFVRLVRARLLPPCARPNLIHLLDVDFLAQVFAKLLTADDVTQRVLIVADDGPISVGELASLVYSHYRRKPHDLSVKLPRFVSDILLVSLRTIGSEKWLVRFGLLFKNWYYETTTLRMLGVGRLTNTREGFARFLDQTA